MFQEYSDKGVWPLSFALQQIVAALLCPIIGSIISFPFSVITWFPYLCSAGFGCFVGFKVELVRPYAVRAGKWVWVLPVIFVLGNIYDYTNSESLTAALRYTLWPDGRADPKALGSVLFTIPASASVGYAIGVTLGAKSLKSGT